MLSCHKVLHGEARQFTRRLRRKATSLLRCTGANLPMVNTLEITEPVLLHCPIRGQLKVAQRAKDGLTFTEEKCRIDAIRFLLQRGYPKEISVLNMLLNGDGKTNIKEEDSLEAYSSKSKHYDLVLCNPPFGKQIVEKRWEVLKKFELGYKWVESKPGVVEQADSVLESQQTGILFAELCVKIAKPGGRIAIILPNGYLGNKSVQHRALREWLLRNTKIVGIVGFPRFTFKKSGTDVCASVLFLEKREKPLSQSGLAKGYNFYAGMVESVGWRAGDKKAVPMYRRDSETGTLILDEDNEPILDADFPKILDEFLRSAASNCFPWLLRDRDIPAGPQSWSIRIEDVVKVSDIALDPKRLCEKFSALRNKIRAGSHIRLGDVLEVVPPTSFKKKESAIYKYVEIDDIGPGDFDYDELRGWQLPGRARLLAEKGDLFIATIGLCWGSADKAGKWFIHAGDHTNVVVTNGCTRLRVKPGKDEQLIDVLVGLCSEAFKVQMRGFSTGSDGLAQVGDEDMLNIVLPTVKSKKERERLKNLMSVFLTSDMRFGKAVSKVVAQIDGWPNPPARKDHWVLV